MRTTTTWLGAGLALGLLATGCTLEDSAEEPTGGTPYVPMSCSTAEVQRKLDAARPGDAVALECAVEGTLTVPAGVILSGNGAAARGTITAPKGAPAVVLVPSTTPGQPTTLGNLDINTAEGTAGVLAQGEGEIALMGVTVTAQLGIGVGLEDLTLATLEDTTLKGPIASPDDAMHVLKDSTPDQIATHGLVMVGVAQAGLRNVSTAGFGGYGALFVRSQVSWGEGGASDNVGVGVMAVGGAVLLENLEICRTLRGGYTLPVYGGAFVSEEVALEDPALETDGPSVGLFGVTACDNDNVGLLYADGQHLEVDGSTVTGNAFAGLAIVDASNVSVTESSFRDTRLLTLPLGVEDAMVTAGDGVQIVHSPVGLSFAGSGSLTNERGGLLVDIGAVPLEETNMKWSSFSVEDNKGFGAMCQGVVGGQASMFGPGAGTIPWDDGILRSDVQTAADTELAQITDALLETIGVVGPCNMPVPSLVLEVGLSALLQRQ